jgi:hypothetical protein
MFAGGWAWADMHNPIIMTVIKLEENMNFDKVDIITNEQDQERI